MILFCNLSSSGSVSFAKKEYICWKSWKFCCNSESLDISETSGFSKQISISGSIAHIYKECHYKRKWFESVHKCRCLLVVQKLYRHWCHQLLFGWLCSLRVEVIVCCQLILRRKRMFLWVVLESQGWDNSLLLNASPTSLCFLVYGWCHTGILGFPLPILRVDQ